MLIFLSESLREQELRAPLAPRVRDALLNLSTAAYEGKHLVTGSRQLFGELIQLASLGPAATGRFRDASALITDAQALRQSVSAYIRVHPVGREPRVELDGPASQIVFNLPIDHFSDSEHVASSRLMGENLRDAVAYVALGEARASQFRGFFCVLKGVEGHGGGTPQAFRVLAEQDAVVLCLVDSDQTDPSASLGRTATDALDCHDLMRALGKVATVHLLPCRELENLLPRSLVLDALPKDPKNAHRVRVWAEQHKLGLVDFVDLKHLVHLQDVSDHLATLTAHKRAELCFAGNVHPALEEAGTLIWSFGLASRRGRT